MPESRKHTAASAKGAKNLNCCYSLPEGRTRFYTVFRFSECERNINGIRVAQNGIRETAYSVRVEGGKSPSTSDWQG